MKKIFLALITIAFFVMGSMLNAANTSVVNSISPEMIQSSYSITVMKIKKTGRVWIKAKSTGNYNSENNTITVHGSTYRVQDNPYYGEEDAGGRGNYSKVAGGIYYFNL